MTNNPETEQTLVTVTQEDRDRAVEFATQYLYPNSSGVRKALAEAFARHREQAQRPTFQSRVGLWMDACFGDTIKADRLERCDRFIEEALELCQTEATFTADRAHALVDYVFGRPIGEAKQEVGGVTVTLAALCNAFGIDTDGAAETELARVWTKVDAIRAKQAGKPTGSALPVAQRTEPSAGEVERAVAKALHEALSRQDVMAYLDGNFDCDALATAAIHAMRGGQGDASDD